MLGILGIFAKKDNFYVVAEDDSPSSTSVVEQTTVTKTVAETTSAPAPAPKTSVKTSKKTGSKTGSAPTTTVASKRLVAPEPFWVKAMENTRNYPKPKQEGSEMTFSTDYLLPQPSNTRRRPGPSLNTFLGMARQIGRRGSI